jgi:hypothetical protein
MRGCARPAVRPDAIVARASRSQCPTARAAAKSGSWSASGSIRPAPASCPSLKAERLTVSLRVCGGAGDAIELGRDCRLDVAVQQRVEHDDSTGRGSDRLLQCGQPVRQGGDAGVEVTPAIARAGGVQARRGDREAATAPDVKPFADPPGGDSSIPPDGPVPFPGWHGDARTPAPVRSRRRELTPPGSTLVIDRHPALLRGC